MAPSIAIVGMACRYPDAASPAQLWETALAQRRAFRRIPPERLRLEDYLSTDDEAADSTYSVEAALIEGYEFERIRFRVAGDTFRSADLAHWLALDVAAQALADAGYAEGEGLARKATRVIVGNTLTGEFSRANLMRLRWPYVRRVLESSLIDEGWPESHRRAFLEKVEATYKAPFPPIGEESLAGGLSNTIAGRICNYFDLKGGGYTVDGACASSLLAVTTACSALAAGDLGVALAGGVDLSLDPFELVGFAKTAALAPDEMRVYDAHSSGFWPGEGCGFVVLMRHEDAVSQGRRVYAVIRGWGISSDGSGGITRPEVEGQLIALRRAYSRASFGVETVPYFEGHGTGTSVGDATELQVLSRARREAAPAAPPAVISSIKANIGHTKAAAGVAGLIKATMALHTEILPPAAGCKEPHPELTCESPALQVLNQAKPWPSDRPLRAGVSAMGFGGINTHIVLEKFAVERRKSLSTRERALISSAQDAELFLLGAQNEAEMKQQVERLLTIAPKLSRAELTDLAAALESSLGPLRVRAAIVASTPAGLTERLNVLRAQLAKTAATQLSIREGVFLGKGEAAPRIGFLFPGQGSPSHATGGILRRRFESVKELYARMDFPEGDDCVATEIAQPAIITASLAALRVLRMLGIEAEVAVGHSLGELVAIHWAGGFDEETLLRIASARGRAMAAVAGPRGAMASIRAGRRKVEQLMNGEPVVIAGLNSPRQTVISGDAAAVAAVVARSRAEGLSAVNLSVSHAFHSPLVKAASPALAECLRREEFHPLRAAVVSTVTGSMLKPDDDLKALLCSQVTSPVRFAEAVAIATGQADLFIEVGPGEVISGLITEYIDTPVIALDAGGRSIKGLLRAVGAAYVSGAPVKHEALFSGRFARHFDIDWHPRFFANPCESAPIPEFVTVHKENRTRHSRTDAQSTRARERLADEATDTLPPLELIRELVAERAELPVSVVRDDSRLLGDLHLNSITVSHLVTEAAKRLGLRRPVSPTNYSDATVAEIAQVLEDLKHATGDAQVENDGSQPTGVDSWVRAFTVEMVERALPRRQTSMTGASVKVIAPPDHPLAMLLRRRLEGWSDGGAVIVCLPPDPDERHLCLLMEGARAVIEEPNPARFVLVQHNGGAASFAKTLHLETHGLTTNVIDVPPAPESVEWILAEMRAAAGYTEARYDAGGRRYEPALRPIRGGGEGKRLSLDSSDVLLVSGGGKGITAECALSLAQQTGAWLILLGLSQPDSDAELSTNLERLAAAGINFRYIAADITDLNAVRSAVSDAVESLGPVTGILHGAALNVPQLLRSMDQAMFLRTLSIKVEGARNLIKVVDPARLKVFITFGSIIARTGLPGEAHYGLANEWLTRLTERFQSEHPQCRCLSIEWSVWSGVGMAQRIGGIERLAQAGITPITPDLGVSMLHRLLDQPPPVASVVVTGRYVELPTLRFEQPELPLFRFLDSARVYYPGVELIVDSTLSSESDPYLSDHVFQDERLFPAVMGLEAMAQAAMALTGSDEPPVFEDVQFSRPIIVPEGESIKVRVAALAREPGVAEVVLRSEETSFQADHFRAVCRFGGRRSATAIQPSPPTENDSEAARPFIDPEHDLYGKLLFHSGRFRRLRGYQLLRATGCIAEIIPHGDAEWFGHYLPSGLTLGDPAVRDAAIHAIQACVPHATLLPIAVDRLTISRKDAPGRLFVHARERKREGDVFTYDLQIAGEDGSVHESWDGLRLQVVGDVAAREPWVEPLLGPFIERRVSELVPGSQIYVAVGRNGEPGRRSRSNEMIRWALGSPAQVHRRYDGKPFAAAEYDVSAAHSGHLTMAVAGAGPVGCDIEPVAARPAGVWRDLLGPERVAVAELIDRETGEGMDAAATRVWSASECLKKAGQLTDGPLLLASTTTDGWVLLSSGSFITATHITRVRGDDSPSAIAVLVRRRDASL